MSWFFGKKKNKESPTESTEEISSPSQSDDYIIEKQTNPFAPGPPDSEAAGNIPSGSGGLYPALSGDRGVMPPMIPSLPGSRSSTLADQNVLGDTQAYLSVIPFELNKELDRDIELDRLRIDEISNFITRVMSQDYQYDFSVEKGVINEMEAATE